MLSATTCKIEIAMEKDVEGCLQLITEVATFYNRGKKFGTVEVKFATEKEVIKHSTTAL